MGHKSSFVDGFEKRANAFVDAIKRAKTPAIVGAGLAGAAYGGAKLLQKAEDPEQAQMRKLRKMKVLPYQGQQ